VKTWKNAHNNGVWRDGNDLPNSLYHQFATQYMTPQLCRKLFMDYNKLTLKKGQSVADYSRKLEAYWADLGLQLNAAGQVDKFVQGLPSSMQMAIFQQGTPADLAVAKERASNAELARSFGDEKTDKDMNKSLLLAVEKIEAFGKQMAEQATSSKPSAVYTAERMPVSNQGTPRRPRNSNNRGNFSRNYNPNNNRYNNNRRFNNNNRYATIPRCRACGKYGHYERWCHENNCTNCGKTGHNANKCSVQPTPKN